MVDQHTCDMCGALIIGSPLRYEVKIQIYAGYDILEISREELEKDNSAELARIRTELETQDEDELAREIFEEFKFDLCSNCRRVYRKSPLGAKRNP